ncbi:MAG TPA: DUF6065 family protein [Azospirillaceae bacterium]|nr:DUF6065 family protein [Azospirillaceae bacterium]
MKMLLYPTWDGAPKLMPGRPDRAWMDAFPSRHPYRCLPLNIANTLGWEFLSPAAFSIFWNGGPRAEDIRVEAEDGYPYLDSIIASHFTRGIVTFNTFHIVRTEPGWNLLISGPVNQPKDGIAPLTGVIETHWLPYTFTMNWQMTRPGVVRWEKDEPFCTIIPVPHGALETVEPEIRDLESDPELKTQFEMWRDTRAEFMARFNQQDAGALKQAWQRYYFRGKLPDETVIDDHRHKVRLAEPVDKRPKAYSTPAPAPLIGGYGYEG